MKVKSDIKAGFSITVFQGNVAAAVQSALANNGGIGAATALNLYVTNQLNVAVPTLVSVSVG